VRIYRVILPILVVLLAGTAVGGQGKSEARRHLIYLHGRIVQERQSARPEHPQFGYYELERILLAFRDRGFIVTGEIRLKSVSVSDAADRVVSQVRELLASGVPADHITVVGASMGAGVALVASERLRNSDVRFCILGACLSSNVKQMRADGGTGPVGHVLVVRESSDQATQGCAEWKPDPGMTSSLVAREIVVTTGLDHGYIYRPLPEWVNPVVEWAMLGQP